ncbi:hypothetical protein H5410_011686 [Solanum commersonii]|uniref:Uncharacterized protein n=1 Tax=Solanum commersonii TaxID=4109 RepID=A0A9J6AQ35_SOLCO|nr:hypothetical protein H5410_011686 [Solanum commersonii]
MILLGVVHYTIRSIENEIKKICTTCSHKGINISSHPKYKSHSECDSFEMIYVNDIPQQDAEAFIVNFICLTIKLDIQADATSKVRHEKGQPGFIGIAIVVKRSQLIRQDY